MDKQVKSDILQRRISKQEEGDYITLPFLVPSSVEKVEIELRITDSEENVIDLGLESPDEIKGWSGGARKHVFICEDRATPGYIPGPITSGGWGVMLNAYRISIEGCQVEIDVQLHFKSWRWEKGDLHLHSNHSDGAYHLQELLAHVKEAGLSFLALTDHNTFSQNTSYPTEHDIAVIPGVELTTNHGHCNFYGVNQPFRDFRCSSQEGVASVIEEGRANHALVSCNHPHCDYCWWEWGIEQYDFKVIEIWNGYWREANKRTLDWWHNQLCEGKKIVAIGGSDKHGPHQLLRYGGPTTWIYTQALESDALVKGIENGTVSLASHPYAPFLDLVIEDTPMGGTKKGDELTDDSVLSCTIHGSIQGYLRIYSSDGLEVEEKVECQDKTYTFPVHKNSLFYRAELWGDDDQLQEVTPQSISNPVYIR